MNLARFLAKALVVFGATDIFGIPGGAVLEILYACEEQEGMTTHLNYHEQAAAYAACGYAQAAGKIGAVYATKGPGVTNYITAMAEAYYDSLPVVFITAHSQKKINGVMRNEIGQEMDTLALVSQYTKYATRIDDLENACEEIVFALEKANEGRKGPVFIDIYTGILKAKIIEPAFFHDRKKTENNSILLEAVEDINLHLQHSERPILLLGDGVHIANVEDEIQQLIYKMGIPVLTSRCAQDICTENSLYYGFVGSHATRYSNFIIEKADLIIVLGNRMAYPIDSKSFSKIRNKKIIRIDVDTAEFMRKIPGANDFGVDLKELLPMLLCKDYEESWIEWIEVCNIIRQKLWEIDVTPIVKLISTLIKNFDKDGCIVCDEGNNELWVSRAYAFSASANRLLYSKTFKTVGSAIGKAIGAYYASRHNVLCFVGDQGFQFNIQELQYISYHKLPIKIIVINNSSPGMMKSSEKRLGYSYFLHTTLQTGYSNPSFKKIACAYEIDYMRISNGKVCDENIAFIQADKPGILEIVIEDSIEVEQILPVGNDCTDFLPKLDAQLKVYLDQL